MKKFTSTFAFSTKLEADLFEREVKKRLKAVNFSEGTSISMSPILKGSDGLWSICVSTVIGKKPLRDIKVILAEAAEFLA